jgi:hypothetical protein
MDFIMKKAEYEPAVFLGLLLGYAFLIVSGITYLTAWILNYRQLTFM